MSTGMAGFAPTVVTMLLGGGILAVATVLSLRARVPTVGFGWAAVAGFAGSLLGLAAALERPESGGLRAGVVQALAVACAAVVGFMCSGAASQERSDSSPLAIAGRGVAWLTLLGLPPTVGFQGKVALYRSLLMVGWDALTACAALASVMILIPASRALASPPPGPLRAGRAAVVVVLIAALLVLGLYPHWTFSIADLVTKL